MADDQPGATRITRRHLLDALGSTGVAVSANSFLLPAAHAGALPRSRPNVIVILADDVGAEELGYDFRYGFGAHGGTTEIVLNGFEVRREQPAV